MANLITTYTDDILTAIAGWNQAAREMVATYATYKKVREREQTAALFDRAEKLLAAHEQKLHAMVTRRGSLISEELKTTVGGLLGSVRGVLGRARSRVASHAVTDLHLILNRLSLNYLELQAHGLALSDVNATRVAVEHYGELQLLLCKAGEELLFCYHAESAREHNVPPRDDLVAQAVQAAWLIRRGAESEHRG